MIFKPGVLVAGWRASGFLKLILCGLSVYVYMCVCMCVCMCVYVCVRVRVCLCLCLCVCLLLRLLITSGMMWCDKDPIRLVKQVP